MSEKINLGNWKYSIYVKAKPHLLRAPMCEIEIMKRRDAGETWTWDDVYCNVTNSDCWLCEKSEVGRFTKKWGIAPFIGDIPRERLEDMAKLNLDRYSRKRLKKHLADFT